MQFVLDKGIYKVARITGPQHNLLGITIGEVHSPMELVEFPMKKGEQRQVDPKSVLSQVRDGLEEVRKELGKEYIVSKVYFVPSDTPSQSVYKLLTMELIRRIESQEGFIEI